MLDTTDAYNEYLALLRRWNARINLVSAGDIERLEGRHLADSLALVKLIPPGTRSLVDLGTGAGFPGLPIAIARPDLHVTLLDAKTKAIAFLKTVRRALDLTNVEFFHGRVSDYQPSPPPDLIVSRAAFPPVQLLEIAATLLGDNRDLDTEDTEDAKDPQSPTTQRHVLVMLNKDNAPPTHPAFEHTGMRPAADDRSNHLYRYVQDI
jgi:16S rRNA (guanine(527)-N(7))-methyltransferase RsmG